MTPGSSRVLSLAALTVLELAPAEMVSCVGDAGYAVAQGMQLIERAAQPNAGLLVDAIHFDRAGDRLGDLAALPRSHLPYMQLCDAPAARPTDRDTLLHQARAERLMPGDGGLDLAGLLRTLPAGIPISIEVPMRTLARTLDARERARRLRAKTLALLDRLAVAA